MLPKKVLLRHASVACFAFMMNCTLAASSLQLLRGKLEAVKTGLSSLHDKLTELATGMTRLKQRLNDLLPPFESTMKEVMRELGGTPDTILKLTSLNQNDMGLADECGYFAVYNVLCCLQACYAPTPDESKQFLVNRLEASKFREKFNGIVIGSTPTLGWKNLYAQKKSEDLSFRELELLFERDDDLKKQDKDGCLVAIPDIYLLNEGYSDILPGNKGRLFHIVEKIEQFRKRTCACIGFIMARAGHYYALIGLKSTSGVDIFVTDSLNEGGLLGAEAQNIALIAKALRGEHNFVVGYLEIICNKFIAASKAEANVADWVAMLFSRFYRNTFPTLEKYCDQVDIEKIFKQLKALLEPLETEIDVLKKQKNLFLANANQDHKTKVEDYLTKENEYDQENGAYKEQKKILKEKEENLEVQNARNLATQSGAIKEQLERDIQMLEKDIERLKLVIIPLEQEANNKEAAEKSAKANLAAVAGTIGDESTERGQLAAAIRTIQRINYFEEVMNKLREWCLAVP